MNIAVLITGGFMIYMVSKVIPGPGFKYIMMAPLLSIVIYILLKRVTRPYTMVFFTFAFAIIMGIWNLYMSLAILITGLSTHLFALPFMASKAFVSASLFACFTGISGLLISKYLIGGIFSELTLNWILVTGALCLIVGVGSSYLAKGLDRYITANENVRRR
jgi:energy-coupling factor transport system substrate-specific component